MANPLFLLDCNICIYLIEGLSDIARQHVESHAPGAIVTSAITYAEVMRGIDPTNVAARDVIDAFFRVCVVLPFDTAAALAFRAVPFRRGKFDHLIAAHTLALDLTLVTANERDFSDIPNLRVENWTL